MECDRWQRRAKLSLSILETLGGRTSTRRKCWPKRKSIYGHVSHGLSDPKEQLASGHSRLATPVVEQTSRARAVQRAGGVTGFVVVKLLPQIVQRVIQQRLGPYVSRL